MGYLTRSDPLYAPLSYVCLFRSTTWYLFDLAVLPPAYDIVLRLTEIKSPKGSLQYSNQLAIGRAPANDFYNIVTSSTVDRRPQRLATISY